MTRRVFKLLLFLYPAKFRRRFGDEILDVVDHYQKRRDANKLRWLLVKDLLSSLARSHTEAFRARGRKIMGAWRSRGVREMFPFLSMDVILAFRNLRRAPAFTAVAVLTLALGIGANSAIFGVVNGVVLRSLPYPEPHRLVTIGVDSGGRQGSMSQPDVRDIQGETRSLTAVAAYSMSGITLTGMGDAEVVQGARVTEGLLEVFDLSPIRGRDIRAEENVPGGPHVVVIGYGFWQERFGGTEEVLGKTLEIRGRTTEIVGIAPPGFDYPRGAQLWEPLFHNTEDCGRDCHFLRVVGRLAPDVALEEAREELSVLAARLEDQYPDSNFEKSFLAVSLERTIVGDDVRLALLVLLGAVGVVLLIACANVAHLMLARASVRTEEMAVRSALGASRLRLVRQLLVEALVLATLGGLAGIVLAKWALDLLLKLAPSNLPRLDEVSTDGNVLLFTLLSVVCVTLVFGLAPALTSSRIAIADALRHSGRAGTGSMGRSPLRSTLLAAEVALSLVLLFAAGLLLKSFSELRSVDLGFDKDNVLTFGIALPQARYPEPERVVRFFEDLEERLQTLPDVKAAGAVFGSPMGGNRINADVHFSDRSAPPAGQEEHTRLRVMTPGYLDTLKVPLLRGRTLEVSDRHGSLPVVLVSKGFADRFYPGKDPLGQQIRVDVSFSYPVETRTIVGIVGDIRSRRVSMNPEPEVYVPQSQMASNYLTMHVRARPGAPPVLSEVRREVRALDPNVPLRGVGSLETAVRRSTGPTRFYSLLLAIFAALAVALATVGLYGVVAYLVARRTREIGIRMALGAGAVDVVRLVLSQGMRPAFVGIVVGLGGAYLASTALRSMLYNVEALDATTLVTVAGLLLAVTMVATLVPARRASRISPVTTLRME